MSLTKLERAILDALADNSTAQSGVFFGLTRTRAYRKSSMRRTLDRLLDCGYAQRVFIAGEGSPALCLYQITGLGRLALSRKQERVA